MSSGSPHLIAKYHNEIKLNKLNTVMCIHHYEGVSFHFTVVRPIYYYERNASLASDSNAAPKAISLVFKT